MKKKLIITISLLFFVFIVTVGLFAPKPKKRKASSVVEETERVKTWKEMNYDEKKAWIEDYIKHDDYRYDLISIMDKEIKRHFEYPLEVEYDFGGRPSFTNAIIGDADSAWVFVMGAGTGKNAFGMKRSFKYNCKLTINDSRRSLDKVSVTIDE